MRKNLLLETYKHIVKKFELVDNEQVVFVIEDLKYQLYYRFKELHDEYDYGSRKPMFNRVEMENISSMLDELKELKELIDITISIEENFKLFKEEI